MNSDEGSQELVIENLENLGDATALIVTREGGQFKIGIQQEKNAFSDIVSNAGQSNYDRLSSTKSAAG